MTDRLRWGIMGAGWIANRFAADLRYGSLGRLARVASRDPGRAAALARRHGAQVAEDYEALVKAADVDAVYVATPASLHRAHCLLALAHGKPVLCEKPFATSAAEAREIADAARSAGVFCMEGIWTRFLPTIVELRRRVAAGEIGEVSQLGAELGFPLEETDATAAITAPSLGGGALLDLGIYGVSMAHDLLGTPETVDATAIRSNGGSIRDVAITMRHGARPALSSVRASHSTLLRNTLDIAGTHGRISVEAPFIQASRASYAAATPSGRGPDHPSALKNFVRSTRLWPVARALARRASGRERGFGAPFRGYGLWFEADEVARCLAEEHRESAIMPLEASVAVLDTMDRVRDAIEVALEPPQLAG